MKHNFKIVRATYAVSPTGRRLEKLSQVDIAAIQIWLDAPVYTPQARLKIGQRFGNFVAKLTRTTILFPALDYVFYGLGDFSTGYDGPTEIVYSII